MKKQATPPNIIARFKTTEEAVGLGFNYSTLSKKDKQEIEDFINNFREGGEFEAGELIEKVYGYLDLMMEHGPSKKAVCSRGCAWCCKIGVDTLKIEALYIQVATGIKIDPKAKKQTGTLGYCPLLNKKTGECTVYQYRPSACRIFYVFDNPKYCKLKNNQAHAIYGVQALLIDGAEKNAVYALMMILLVMEENYNNGNRDIRDIRDFFL